MYQSNYTPFGLSVQHLIGRQSHGAEPRGMRWLTPPEHHLTVIMITIKNDPFIMSEVFIGIRAPNQSIGIQLPPTHHYIATW